MEYEQYSASGRVTVDNIQFIDDPVVGSQITPSNPSNMPLRQSGCVEYNFTKQETKFLTTENTCVIGYPASTQIPVQDFSDLNVLNRYNIWMYNCLWFYHITITIL